MGLADSALCACGSDSSMFQWLAPHTECDSALVPELVMQSESETVMIKELVQQCESDTVMIQELIQLCESDADGSRIGTAKVKVILLIVL